MIKATYRCMNCYKEFYEESPEQPDIPMYQQLNTIHDTLRKTVPITKLHLCNPERPQSARGFGYPVKIEHLEIIEEETT